MTFLTSPGYDLRFEFRTPDSKVNTSFLTPLCCLCIIQMLFYSILYRSDTLWLWLQAGPKIRVAESASHLTRSSKREASFILSRKAHSVLGQNHGEIRASFEGFCSFAFCFSPHPLRLCFTFRDKPRTEQLDQAYFIFARRTTLHLYSCVNHSKSLKLESSCLINVFFLKIILKAT